MNVRHVAWCMVVPVVILGSCGPSGESSKSGAEGSKEAFYQRGHHLYQTMDLESAEPELLRAVELDSTYVEPLVDLGSLSYDLGRRFDGEKNPGRLDRFRRARRFFARAEALGYRDEAAYERLSELSLALDDAHGFLAYAKKTAALFPYDRQLYNLGLAYFGVEDWQSVIKSQKEAAEKFRQSPYLGGFYRQLGRAYMKIDRDQTAERTLVTGVQAVDARLAAKGALAADERKRLVDDKIGMLLLLKRLHTTYGAAEKLANVERQLKEAGYQK
jgi:tetratricopeptide (TPR) repeat protein